MIVVLTLGIRVETSGRAAETVALACSGYEARDPQLMVPVKPAEELDYRRPKRALEAEFVMAEDLLKVWVVSRGCKVQVLARDARSLVVEADLVISPMADDLLLNDKLMGELQLTPKDKRQDPSKYS